jgi:GT2 family glycosyltransferase
MGAHGLNIVVGIATTGRAEILARTIDLLAQQTRLPDRLVICPARAGDVDASTLERFPMPAAVVQGPVGLPAQRNKILSAAVPADIIVFFDDDFFAEPDYLANLENIFVAHPDVVGVTGALLADGAQGPGLSVEQGLQIVRSSQPEKNDRANRDFIDCYGAYGCNMAFRLKCIELNGIWFDENLPLYGWQEDIDFSQRLLPYGRIAKSAALRGVHLGIKLGRTSGVRFGYSQIANPVYLIAKGTMSWRHAGKLIWRNLAANSVRCIYPEPWIDRKGRLKGNVLALIDMALGRISPLRILQL